MKDLLAPKPLSAAQVADLVARVRAAAERRKPKPRLRRSYQATTLCRVAARLAFLAQISVAAAAASVGDLAGRRITGGGTQKAWRKLYPGVPARVSLRSGTDVVRAAAIWAREQGATFAEAAQRFGCGACAVRTRYYRLFPGLRDERDLRGVA